MLLCLGTAPLLHSGPLQLPRPWMPGAEGMELLEYVLQDWVTQKGLSWSWKLRHNIESNVPTFASTPGGYTHTSPGSLFWLPPAPTWTQGTAPRDPKAKCKCVLSSSSHRSRGALGWGSALLQPGLCVP